MRLLLLVALVCCSTLIPEACRSATYDFGLNLALDLPQADFANISGTGAGVGLKFLRPLSGPHLRLRGDFDLLFFGEEEQVGDIGGQPWSVVTRYESMRFLAGLEISTSSARRWRVYLAPVAGLYYFRSIDRIQFTYYSETRSSETDFGWKVDAGFTLSRFRRPHRPRGLELDFGASYGTVRGAVTTETVEGQTLTSDANEVIIHVGVIWHRR